MSKNQVKRYICDLLRGDLERPIAKNDIRGVCIRITNLVIYKLGLTNFVKWK